MQKSPETAPKDNLPRGDKLPEGVACDLARAFIQRDEKLLTATCLLPAAYNAGLTRKEYEAFLKSIREQMKKETTKSTPSPMAPKAILTVYAARPLSHNGPASYGYAVFSFKNIQFVDVEVLLHSGKKALNRTLVVQLANQAWRVHPLPSISPLLSMGLNQEKPSTTIYTGKK